MKGWLMILAIIRIQLLFFTSGFVYSTSKVKME